MSSHLRRPANGRLDMPEITGFVDALRDAFGREEIDSAIKRGLRDGTFWALEGGFVVGSPPASAVDNHTSKLDQPLDKAA
jgi:hypothetical protein